MRKVLYTFLSLLFVICMMGTALADGDKVGAEYTIDAVCSFTVKSIIDYDVFFNQESGTSKQYLVVSFELLNRRTEPFYLKTETDAKVIYDGDFEFEADHLWTNPLGTFYCSKSDAATSIIRIYAMDNNGAIFSNLQDAGNGYEAPTVSGNTYNYYYYPDGDFFDYRLDGPTDYALNSTDSSKTILDPLVKRTYHYVFLVPNLVAEEEGARELILTIDDEEYSFRF